MEFYQATAFGTPELQDVTDHPSLLSLFTGRLLDSTLGPTARQIPASIGPFDTAIPTKVDGAG